MDKLKQTLLIAHLLDRVKSTEPWSGQSHIQASLYFLQSLCPLPLTYKFYVYRHALHSFDLSDDLTEMRADGLLETSVQEYPTEPKLTLTSTCRKLMQQYQAILEDYNPVLDFLSCTLGTKRLSEWELLAIGLYLSTSEPRHGEADPVQKLVAARPGTSPEKARLILEAVEHFVQESGRIPVPA